MKGERRKEALIDIDCRQELFQELTAWLFYDYPSMLERKIWQSDGWRGHSKLYDPINLILLCPSLAVRFETHTAVDLFNL